MRWPMPSGGTGLSWARADSGMAAVAATPNRLCRCARRVIIGVLPHIGLGPEMSNAATPPGGFDGMRFVLWLTPSLHPHRGGGKWRGGGLSRPACAVSPAATLRRAPLKPHVEAFSINGPGVRWTAAYAADAQGEGRPRRSGHCGGAHY